MNRYRQLRRKLVQPGSRTGDFLNELRWKYRGMFKVGEDQLRNEYFLVQKRVDEPVRRWVLYHPDIDQDVHALPHLWGQWLRYIRDYPPSQRELKIWENAIQNQRGRNSRWDQKDMELREEEVAMGMHKKTEEEASYFELMEQQQKEEEERIEAEEERQREELRKQEGNLEPVGEGKDFKPGVWRPHHPDFGKDSEEEEEEEEMETWKPTARKR